MDFIFEFGMRWLLRHTNRPLHAACLLRKRAFNSVPIIDISCLVSEQQVSYIVRCHLMCCLVQQLRCFGPAW